MPVLAHGFIPLIRSFARTWGGAVISSVLFVSNVRCGPNSFLFFPAKELLANYASDHSGIIGAPALFKSGTAMCWGKSKKLQI
jgi:hypothetical protein